MKTLLQFLLLVSLFISTGTFESFSQTTLFAAGSTWKYNDLGQDLGTSWVNSGYNDSGWSSGMSEFGYGDGDEQTSVSFGPDSDNKHVTTYFRKTFYVSNPSQYQQIIGSVLRDDGVVVYVNGTEVFRDNLPAGTINNQTFAASTIAFFAEDDYHDFAFSPGLLNNGNNTISVEIHQDEASSSDISFNMSLSGSTVPFNVLINREPYLNSGTENSMVIKWQTDVACDGKISYGTSLSNLNMSESVYPYTTDHEITISGLLPGTKYYYTVGTSGNVLSAASSIQYFKTTPVEGTSGNYRFWAIGDAGMSDGNQQAVRDGFLDYNDENHLDGWILLGDNAYGSGINDGTQSCYQTAMFNDMYSSLISKTVCWPATGNHDYNNHIPFSPSPAYFDIFTLPVNGEAGGVPSGSEKYYSYNYGNIHFVVLDSYDEDRSANSTMVQWLINDLEQNTAEWTIAYWHHPPYTKGSHDSDNPNFLDGDCVEMRENILPIIEEYGVDLVLNGHSHSYERTFLLDSHYGNSGTLTPSMILDDGTGGLNDECPYQKQTQYSKSHQGTVYAVVGCSGKLSSVASSWPHVAMSQYSHNHLGSMVINISENRLDANFIDAAGDVIDYFSIVKNAGISDTLLVCPNDSIVLKPSFPGQAHWMPLDIVADSIVVPIAFSTMFIATDTNGCISDTFFVQLDNSSDCNLSASEWSTTKPTVYLTLWENSEKLPIGWKGFTSENIRLEIISVLGDLILDEILPNSFTGNSFFLNTGPLSDQVYFIRVSDKEQSVITKYLH